MARKTLWFENGREILSAPSRVERLDALGKMLVSVFLLGYLGAVISGNYSDMPSQGAILGGMALGFLLGIVRAR